jgi:hypothetical protein
MGLWAGEAENEKENFAIDYKFRDIALKPRAIGRVSSRCSQKNDYKYNKSDDE